MSYIYDVIIVGAGPAGGTAAYFLGKAGKRVLLLEKEYLPSYKTCGSGLCVNLLQRQFPFSFEPTVQGNVRAISYAYDGRIVTIPINRGQVGMVMRDQFDKLLVEQAQVELRQEVAVRKVVENSAGASVEIQNGEHFECRYLIGAAGASSVVAYSLGLRQGENFSAVIEAEVEVAFHIM
jgi:flavin-dependent dehydrogenase